MNIALVSHCNFLGQSAYHVHSIAKKLTERGCSCMICVPDGQASAKQHIDSDIPIMDYEIALNKGLLFADGKGPALIHCWTPREHVRRFTESIVVLYKCPYIVHLEDNEPEILKRYLKSYGYDEFNKIQADELDRLISSSMIHPHRYMQFLQKASGVTVLMDRLLEHVPPGVPGLVFWPGADELFSHGPAGSRSELRKKYGIKNDSFVIYYSGNFHAINRGEVEQFLLALSFLENSGMPLHFIKTGITTLPDIMEKVARDASIKDFGFVPRNQLPELLAISDIVVQPGASDAFNDYRFPSKLPEALFAGKPVIIPRCNLGRFLTDGFNALITDTGTWDELAGKILALYNNPGLRRVIGANGRHFAMAHLPWEKAVEKIFTFYKEACFSHTFSFSIKRDLAMTNDLLGRLSGNDPSCDLPEIRESLIRIQNYIHNISTADESIQEQSSIAAEISKETQRLKYNVMEQEVLKPGIQQFWVEYQKVLNAIEKIRDGFSRRITAPMRFAASKIKNIGAILKLLPSIVRFGGGVVGSAKKAWRVFSREGWCGVKRRILFVGGNRNVCINSKIRPDLFSAEVDRNDYTEWIRRYDTLTSESRAAMRDRMNDFARKSFISVLMPVYNPKPGWLIEAIESMRRQIYPYWELCIADDASTDKKIRLILEDYAGKDERIKVIFREKTGNISSASNSALSLTSGEWIALLDHDDLLAEHALFFVADAINQNPDACLIYSDEDKIDASGKRFDPYFKSDWNKDLFYSHNMISHLGAYRADLLREIGGFKEGLEGAQDYDLALRFIERSEATQIIHIPRVLYHWRMHARSTAKSIDTKPYAVAAGQKALNEHFQRIKMAAQAEYAGCGYRVRYALPDVLPFVSLIILTKNKFSLLKTCVESILEKTSYSNYEILIVDNASDDPSTIRYLQGLQRHPRIRVVRDNRPFNFSSLNNAAVKLARGGIIGLLNNDVEVISAGWLSEMVSHALRPDVGAVGARLWYHDHTLQHGGVILGIGGVAGHAHKGLPCHHHGYFCRGVLIQNFSAVTAASLVIQKKIYEEIGGFNEGDLAIAFNDIDFCLRVVKSGYRNVWTPYAELYHHESASRGYENTAERQNRFAKEVFYMKRQWGDVLMSDCAYSPNLTMDYEDFSLAWPPRVIPINTCR